ncbi:L,D-transpeptidase-like protein [Pontibacter ummariensis]|uniref:L,D-transpeptidase catalytic domain n=1 Tax=Pontibacter ummariensis TaxID=1610492 RepID=A0A239FTL3_9BACT|nr:murein L,D-transpeptidase catalytic domain family protein [Pontibacter ummariensis]PRY11928.1 L,D-transpeptidase-like protein [Pontibacter ummariensis]SNS60221.1 L,D-transpeptidase catalytic domain [Pontibacter ummariensis]
MLRVLATSLTLGLLSFTLPASRPLGATPEPLKVEALTVNNKATALTYAEKQQAFNAHLKTVYEQAGLQAKGLAYDVFEKAMIGYQNFKQSRLTSARSILTVIDFTKSSGEKRMWIIDLDAKKVLINTLVAHGRNTGEDKALKFSNTPNSYMSSLGFYLTDATYFGKHGLSLRLQGMDKTYNSNAMARAIVVHGADYATEAFVKQHGRLGRSLGCPSVPREISDEVIAAIKDKTVMYIHGNDSGYTSSFLNVANAVEAFALETANENLS